LFFLQYIYCAYVCEYGVPPLSFSFSLRGGGERFVAWKREDVDEKGEQKCYLPPHVWNPNTWDFFYMRPAAVSCSCFLHGFYRATGASFFLVSAGKAIHGFYNPARETFSTTCGCAGKGGGIRLIDTFSMNFVQERKGGGGIVYGPVSFYVPLYYVIGKKGCWGRFLVCLFFLSCLRHLRNRRLAMEILLFLFHHWFY